MTRKKAREVKPRQQRQTKVVTGRLLEEDGQDCIIEDYSDSDSDSAGNEDLASCSGLLKTQEPPKQILLPSLEDYRYFIKLAKKGMTRE